jgi:proteic killer suppression protein
MDLSFGSARLQRNLSDESRIRRYYGQLAPALRIRLSVLARAKRLSDIPTGPPDRCHQLTNNRDEQFAVKLSPNERLVFRVANDPIPRLPDGGIDRDAVTAIEINEIVDYHDS